MIFREEPLAVLAIEKITHRLPPRFVGFTRSLPLIGVHALFRAGIITRFGSTALGATVSKAGLVRLQLKLF